MKAVETAKRLFDHGLFFEVHELLEELWSNEFGELREFLQALIQLGVAFYHKENYNPRGYRLLLENAGELLEGYSGVVCGIDVDRLKKRIKEAAEDLDYPFEGFLG